MDTRTYLRLLDLARRQSRVAAEAEDLLQYALTAAIEAGRADMSRSENRGWLAGVLRNRARHEARSTLRRRQREREWVVTGEVEPVARTGLSPFVDTLPPALRTTALLVLTGHTKPEIAWLLGVSDAALRKRFGELRLRSRRAVHPFGPDAGVLRGDLAYGILRRALIRTVQSPGTVLGSHDPDGNLFIVTSQTGRSRQR